MRPSLHTNQTYLYCLGRAAELGSVSVHAAIAMSTHHHTPLTDRGDGGIADFAEWMHGQFGRAINRSIGHWEGFWDPTRSYSAQLLGIAGELDPIDYAEDVLERMVYAITNPVCVFHVGWTGIPAERGHSFQAKVITYRSEATPVRFVPTC